MASVSAHKDKALYVLVGEHGHYWLTTLSTNRADCYKAAKPGCRTENHRKELREEGFRCVRVKIIETED
jgi:hypothetical protein